MAAKKTKRINWILLVVLIIFTFCFNLPIISMIGTAFKGNEQALSDLSLFPAQPKLSAFRAMAEADFLYTVVNSFKIAIAVTVFCVIIACLAGYAVSRFKGRVFSFYSLFMLVLQMFPITLLLIPLFLIYRSLGLIDSPWSLIISYTCTNLPFSVWLLKGFFDTISFEIEEAALIDGCGRFKTLWRIVLPVSAPGISTVAIFTFLNCWNEYTLANTFIRSEAAQTLTVGLQRFVGQNSSSWGTMAAAATVSTIPTVIFLLVAQKYLIQGMTAGSVKS